jgi:DNA-binding SARP family transcriptional activator
LRSRKVAPLRKGLCQLFVAWFYVNVPQERAAQEAISQLQGLAEDNGLEELHRFTAATAYWLEMTHSRRAEAARYIGILEGAMDPARPYDLACVQLLKAWSLTLAGEPQAALRPAQQTLAIFDRAGWTWHRILARGVVSWIYTELKDYDSARRWSRQGRALADETNIHVLDAHFDQLEAVWLIAHGEDAQPALQRLFSGAAQYGTGLPLRFFPTVIPRLCALALQSNIEVSYVRALIRVWEWRAEDTSAESWPWPVRIYLLGRFELYVNGERVNFSARAPRKVLALLKALVCLGAQNVRDRRLVDTLWSEDEADAAKAAFNVTLYRLRKLLVQSDAIEVKDGALRLNTEVCWVDAMAFEHLLQGGQSRTQTEVALALYRGNLLPEDEDEPWSNYLREKLRRKFLHEVERVGHQLEQEAQWQKAIAHYQRALDADNLAEAYYRGLMRCLHALDRAPEAISVYQRMERLFSITLGLSPTAESQGIYRSLFSRPVPVAGDKAGMLARVAKENNR